MKKIKYLLMALLVVLCVSSCKDQDEIYKELEAHEEAKARSFFRVEFGKVGVL